MITIPLVNRSGACVGSTIVDDADASCVAQYVWRLRTTGSGMRYASRTENGQEIYLHGAVVGKLPRAYTIDHVNRDGLDNRRANLRPATRAQNQQNRRVHWNSKSGVRGVCWDAAQGKWRVSVKQDGKRIYSARFVSLSEAADAARRARLMLFSHATE